jgi:hypothetical protein
MKRRRIVTIGAAIIAAVAISLAVSLGGKPADQNSAASAGPHRGSLPARPDAYFGAFATPSPQSYAGVTAFTASTGVRPSVVVYYSGWLEPFKASFAAAAVKHHAVPLVQIDPNHTSLSAIASGQYDAYLRSYAAAVRALGARVILSFAHEMNGSWYSWGNGHTSPAVFIAAWRHIVTVFRQQRADNVTWLWTVNVMRKRGNVPSPAPWWPGSSYVNWVGIDGYYNKPSGAFAPLFGPTIVSVRALTTDPILISETGAKPAVGQPDKIADLFAGVHAYGLLGFVWFDVRGWRLSSPAAIAAFRQGANTYKRPAS